MHTDNPEFVIQSVLELVCYTHGSDDALTPIENFEVIQIKVKVTW